MNCMKCGKEIPERQAFCPECLADMSRYPVKPGTPIQLPTRSAKNIQKQANRKKEVSLEKKIRRQRRAIVILSLALTVSLILLSLTGFYLWQRQTTEVPDETIGQNYNAAETEAS